MSCMYVCYNCSCSVCHFNKKKILTYLLTYCTVSHTIRHISDRFHEKRNLKSEYFSFWKIKNFYKRMVTSTNLMSFCFPSLFQDILKGEVYSSTKSSIENHKLLLMYMYVNCIVAFTYRCVHVLIYPCDIFTNKLTTFLVFEQSSLARN